MMPDVKTINIIGSGRVANKLGEVLISKQYIVQGIYSRNRKTGEALAKRIGAGFFEDIKNLPITDLTILAVKDDAIQEVSAQMKNFSGIVVHTSGAAPLQVLNEEFNRGVFYPLQSFSAEADVNWKEVPFCIEAENEETYVVLEKLACKISDSVFRITTKQREQLHLAAVFANNFVNHMITVSDEILQKANIDKAVLLPLIDNTIAKIKREEAKYRQTGPAIRGDFNTIEKHKNLLSEFRELQEVYEVITNNIIHFHNDKKL